MTQLAGCVQKWDLRIGSGDHVSVKIRQPGALLPVDAIASAVPEEGQHL